MILAGSPAGKVGCADIKGPFFCLKKQRIIFKMSTRLAKQVIYGTLYLLIAVGIFYAIYARYIRVAPSCFDNVQNQNEEGVDCGGVCAKTCTFQLENITVGDFKTFTSSPGKRTFLARVENQNTGFGAKSFRYEFDIYDASGTAILSFPGQSFIYDSEVKYLVLANVAVPAVMDHAGLVITDHDWVPAAEMGIVPRFGNPLTITGDTVTSSTVTVTGIITDDDISSFNDILIVAIFYSESGFPVGASQAQLDKIAPHETKSFSVSYPAIPGINPALTKVYAYALRP